MLGLALQLSAVRSDDEDTVGNRVGEASACYWYKGGTISILECSSSTFIEYTTVVGVYHCWNADQLMQTKTYKQFISGPPRPCYLLPGARCQV